MTRLSRKLLFAAMMFWIAPLPAQQRPAEARPQGHNQACPKNKPVRTIVVLADWRVGEISLFRAAGSAVQP